MRLICQPRPSRTRRAGAGKRMALRSRERRVREYRIISCDKKKEAHVIKGPNWLEIWDETAGVVLVVYSFPVIFDVCSFVCCCILLFRWERSEATGRWAKCRRWAQQVRV